MLIEVATTNRRLVFEALNTKTMQPGQSIDLVDGVRVALGPVTVRKMEGVSEIAAFFVTVAAHVPASLAAETIVAWIKEKLAPSAETLSIDRTKIDFNKDGTLKRFVSEKITRTKR